MSEENKDLPTVDPDVLGETTPSFDMDFGAIEQPITPQETKEETPVESTPVVEEKETNETKPDINSKLMDALEDKPKSVRKPRTKKETVEEKKEEPIIEERKEEKNVESSPKEEKKSDIILESEIDKKKPENSDTDTDEEEETEREKNDRIAIENLSSELEKMYENISALQEEINQESIKFSDDKEEDGFIIDKSNKSKGKEDEKKKKLNQMIEDFQKKTEEYQHSISKFNLYGAEIENSFGPYVSSENTVLKKLGSRKLEAKDFGKLVPNDADTKSLFLSQYINMDAGVDSPVSGHRITRVPCLLSGYYAEIKTFTFSEMVDFIRKSNEPAKTFKTKFSEELEALFNHINWTSYQKKGEPLNIDEWLQKTKLPDLDQIYFGAYDASFPGTTSYNITCGNCNQEFPIEKTNKQLCYHLNNRGDSVLSDNFIHDVLLQKKSVEEMKNTKIYQIANTLYEEKVIHPNNIKVSYGTPTILDALETCAVIEDNYSQDFPDTSGILDPRNRQYPILRLFTSIKKLVVPLNGGYNEEGKMIVKFYEISTEVEDIEERLEARKNIIKVLNDLPEAQFSELFEGREVSKKINVRGIQHLIPDVFCPNCQRYIGNINLSMRTTFFMHTTEIVNGIVSVT